MAHVCQLPQDYSDRIGIGLKENAPATKPLQARFFTNLRLPHPGGADF